MSFPMAACSFPSHTAAIGGAGGDAGSVVAEGFLALMNLLNMATRYPRFLMAYCASSNSNPAATPTRSLQGWSETDNKETIQGFYEVISTLPMPTTHAKKRSR